MKDNVAAFLAYITFIPAVIFLVMDPYNKSPLIRFHAWQSIFFSVGSMVLQYGLNFIGLMTHMSLLMMPVSGLLSLAILAGWIICLMKAYKGEMFKLPVIGDLAAQQAEKA